ncbi:hypothetical protein C9374_009509 [Naegleria lovaniensis]|uniref:Uncharacterized protein n=1 Tax=Naegleria lovaniensis TaxID=51637 RepID=A0AA88KR53_NAELO|nr:uncharacterized protein C9374_009509 [Naegleria lovaniensis]KAG2392932.1 hypothetical protein C9374_009509 [Naegleria lovaniensis]
MSTSNPSTDNINPSTSSAEGTTTTSTSSPPSSLTTNKVAYHVMPEDVRGRLLDQSSVSAAEATHHIDTFVFHFMHERGFTKPLESYEIALQLFNKRRLIKLIQAGEFERAMAYLTTCKRFIRDSEYNTVMRRIFYAFFPCLMLKGETARALKLITEMENLGLYDQEAKLKYGDLLKFDKLSNVISRDMVISKCAEVVSKDLENIEDHFCVDKPDIPSKFEKLDSTALINSLQYVFDFNPTKQAPVSTTKNMNVEATTVSIWSAYSRPTKKTKITHVSSAVSETETATPSADTQSVATHKQLFSLVKQNEVKIFDSPIHSIITHSGSNTKAIVTTIIGGEKDKRLQWRVFNIKDFQELKNQAADEKLAEYVHMGESEFPPSMTFAVNTLFIEIANRNMLLLLKLESDKFYNYTFNTNMTSILMQGDTTCPLVGTATGDLYLASIKLKSIELLGNIDNSAIVMILTCAENESYRYLLLRNGKVCRVELNKEGKLIPDSILKYEPDAACTAIPYMMVNPQKPTELLVKYDTAVRVVVCGKSFRKKSAGREWKDLSAACYSHDGIYTFISRTDGTISVWGGASLLERGTLLDLGPNDYATFMTLAENNTLLIGTKNGRFISYEVVSNK